MNVSIIYVNYKTSALIIESIKSVKEKTSGICYEIIVVDNNSEDNSLTRIYSVHSDIICIQSQENIGFGRANNLGIEIAKGDCIFFLNPDTILINNAIKVLHEYLINNKEVGACGGNLYSIDMEPAFSFGIRLPSFTQEILSIFYLSATQLSPQKSAQFNYSNSPLEVATIMGADLLIKSEILKKIGGFDPVFFMNYEETDLCHRIKDAGYKIVSVPNAKIIHLEGKSDYIPISRLSFLYQGQYIYFEKHYGYLSTYIIYGITQLKNLIRIMQFYLLMDEKKIVYWKTKATTNYKVFLAFIKRAT